MGHAPWRPSGLRNCARSRNDKLEEFLLAACKRKIAPPDDVVIDGEVNLHLGDGGYALSARLSVSLPGVERELV